MQQESQSGRRRFYHSRIPSHLCHPTGELKLRGCLAVRWRRPGRLRAAERGFESRREKKDVVPRLTVGAAQDMQVVSHFLLVLEASWSDGMKPESIENESLMEMGRRMPGVELPDAGIAAKRRSGCTLTVMTGWDQVVERPAGVEVGNPSGKRWWWCRLGPWAVARLPVCQCSCSLQHSLASPRTRAPPFKTGPVPCRDALLPPPPHRADTMLNFKI